VLLACGELDMLAGNELAARYGAVAVVSLAFFEARVEVAVDGLAVCAVDSLLFPALGLLFP
jgi:hypothetical protein